MNVCLVLVTILGIINVQGARPENQPEKSMMDPNAQRYHEGGMRVCGYSFAWPSSVARFFSFNKAGVIEIKTKMFFLLC